MRALLTGQGALADALDRLLQAQGWQVRRAALATDARLAGDETLVLTVPPAATDDWQGAMAAGVLAPVRLAEALAAAQPAPQRDTSGELRAPAQVVHVIDRTALVPGAATPAHGAACAALVSVIRDQALRLAPRLRVNGMALDPASAPDAGPVLCWLLAAHAVTGQIPGLGPEPRPVTGWRRGAEPPNP